jgi:hypothetical protein
MLSGTVDQSWRKACTGIDPRGAAARHKRSDEAAERDYRHGDNHSSGVGCGNAKQHGTDESRQD